MTEETLPQDIRIAEQMMDEMDLFDDDLMYVSESCCGQQKYSFGYSDAGQYREALQY